MQPLGVGIVGTGLSAAQHLTALAQVPSGRVVAVAGTSVEKARAFAEHWAIPRAYGSATELIADPDVEIVHTCTPPDRRLELVEQCAAGGKHVLLEKPIARDLAEADRIIAVCDRAGVTLGAMFQYRFTPLARRVKEAVDAGELGRLLLVTVASKWFRTTDYYTGSSWRGTAQREGGGVLINQAIHVIDLLGWVCGPVSEVHGLTATTLHPIEMEDVGLALLRFSNGAVGSIVASTVAYPGFSERIELHSERGSLTLIQGEGRLEWRLRGQDERTETAADQVSKAGSDPAGMALGGHAAEFADLYMAIRQGRRPLLDGRAARPALELVEAIYRSSREQRPIRLAQSASGVA